MKALKLHIITRDLNGIYIVRHRLNTFPIMSYVPISQIKQMLDFVSALLIFYFTITNFSIQYIVNLFIILGLFFIHKCTFLGKNQVDYCQFFWLTTILTFYL